jgi:antitoxin CptB
MYQEAGITYNDVQPTDRTRLRWRARRGMLENDLVIERFFNQFGDALTDQQVQGLSELLERSDNELLELFMRRKELDASSASEQSLYVLEQLRQ